MFSKRREDPNAVVPPPLNNEKDNGIWIFVGNLTEEISEIKLRELFTEFGQVNKIFLNTKLGFASVQMDTLQSATTAIENLNGIVLYGKEIKLKLPSQGKSVEINTSSTSIKVENLSAMVTNELLLKAFSQFGIVEKAIVTVDSKGKSTTRGIVEFNSELSAQNAVKQIEEGCFLTTTYPKPLEAKLMEDEDSICGLSEEKITKTSEYYNEIKVGPRMAMQGTFEEELARTYKVRYQLERKQREQFEANIAISRRIFEEEMLTCWTKQQQALNIKQEVLSFEERLEEEESKKKFEARRRIQMEKQIMEMNQREEDVDETPSEKKVAYSIPMLTDNFEQETSRNEASQIEEITTNDTGVGLKRHRSDNQHVSQEDKEPHEKKRREMNNEENGETSSPCQVVVWRNNKKAREIAKVQNLAEENDAEEMALELYRAPTEEQNATEYLQKYGLLPKEVNCGKCGALCRFQEKSQHFRCDKQVNGRRCNYKRTLRKGTFLAHCVKDDSEFLAFLAMYLSKDFNSEQVVHELRWTDNTVTQWSVWCGEVCEYFVKTQPRIGGPDTVVEIDETRMCQRKQMRGKIVHAFWVVVGKERGSNKRFSVNFEGNPRTEGDKLVEIIKKCIIPGGIVITDNYPSYNQLNNHGYTHQVIDGKNVFRTQSLKNFLTELRKGHVVRRGRAPRNMPLRICRCIFIASFTTEDERLHQFLINAAKMHPC